MRTNERKNNERRTVEFIPHYITHPEGAVLVSFGNTKVICTATIENKLPPFMRGQGKGWITAEYSMLPRRIPEIFASLLVENKVGERWKYNV